MSEINHTHFSQPQSILLLGSSGLVGSAIAEEFSCSCYQVIAPTSSHVDLQDTKRVRYFIDELHPDVVIHAAGQVGGIGANMRYGFELGVNNAAITTNVLMAAYESGIDKLIYLGCGCSYPNNRSEPMTPSDLFDGPVEPTSRAYALAKSLGLELTLQARNSGRSWVSIVPSNLYGPHDNFDPLHAHVVPSLIRKMHLAKSEQLPVLRLRGSGRPLRQFLHSFDLAAGLQLVCDNVDRFEPIVNIGGDNICSIAELARTVAEVTGFAGTIEWDTASDDGTSAKILDDTQIRLGGWTPQFDLPNGIAQTYSWILTTSTLVRGWDCRPEGDS
ncbi:MAG TPA: NAD-dependent epimerase/dehydratase family protein [Acidimicrobiales bacterium]|nr:NAD-dependent epimerase/dehydratase family protein [Acidimicrobiales bacterium]